jgi:uncharacterized protein YgiM (DUF1202 family)
MIHRTLYFFAVVIYLFYAKGVGLAETMYVTDRLRLSLRNAPGPEQPALDLLSSDTKVDVLETEGKWARVRLEDGRTGWVWKRFLVKDFPKSLIIEQLKRQIENENITTERLRGEITSLEKEIESLKGQLTQQNERIELTIKENNRKRYKGIYATGIVTLFAGFIIGYLVRRPKRIGF